MFGSNLEKVELWCKRGLVFANRLSRYGYGRQVGPLFEGLKRRVCCIPRLRAFGTPCGHSERVELDSCGRLQLPSQK